MTPQKAKPLQLDIAKASVSKTTNSKVGNDVNDFNASTPSLATAQLIHTFTATIDGVQTACCNGRELHNFMAVQRDFTTWIKGRIQKFGFVEGVDYLLAKSGEKVLPQSGENLGGRPSSDYHLTLDMAKELAMVENNEQGRQARRYFIACEKQALGDAPAQPNPGTLHGVFKGNDEAARVAAILKSVDLFPQVFGSVAWLGKSKRDQATAANEIVQQITGMNYLALAGNPHLKLDLFDDARSAGPTDQQKQIERLVLSMRKSLRYRPTKKQPAIQDNGIMTHTQLLRVMHMPAVAFAELIETALAQKIIKQVSGQPYGYGGTVYTLTGVAA